MSDGRSWYALSVRSIGIRPQRTDSIDGSPVPLRAPVISGRPNRYLPPFPAEIAIARAGYNAFVPTERWMMAPHGSRKRGGKSWRRIEMMKPLIPGFALVNLVDDPGFNWLRLLTQPYVLGVYGKLKAISNSDVQAIMAMEQRLWSKNAYGLKPGDVADMTAGGMKGHEIRISKVVVSAGEAVVKGLTDLFGREVEIEVPILNLRGAK